MKSDLLPYLRCLKCDGTEFELTVGEENDIEIRTGTLACVKCGQEYAVRNGVADFLIEPSEVVLAEIEGTEKMHKKDGFDEEKSKRTLLMLPDYEGDDSGAYGHYTSLKANFDAMTERLDLHGKVLLDVGAAQAWTSNRFAQAGAFVISSDIVLAPHHGLESADFFIEEGTYFERVRADMHKLPIKFGSVDIVLFNNVLHHSSDVGDVIALCFKLLKPGGKLVLIGEPSAGIFTKKEEFGKEQRDQYDINENIYSYSHYRKVISDAGFRNVRYFFPPAIDVKLSSGKYGWRQVNTGLFRFIHFFWSRAFLRNVLKRLLFRPSTLLYTSQVHCIAEK